MVFIMLSKLMNKDGTVKSINRSNNRILFGVCAGIANHFGVRVGIIRFIALAGLVMGFFLAIFLYIYLIFAMGKPKNNKKC